MGKYKIARHSVGSHFSDLVRIDVNRFSNQLLVKDLLSFNECAERISLLRCHKVSPGYNPIAPKVAWKLQSYCQGVFFRTIDLFNGSALALNSGNMASAVTLVRGLVEVSAAFWAVYRGVEKGVFAGSVSEIDDAIMKGVFANRWENWEEGYKATNIMTHLSHMERDVFGKGEKHITEHYGAISEIAHPNWSGTVGLFGKIDKKRISHNFSVRRADNNRVHLEIVAGYSSLNFIESTYSGINGLMENVIHLANVEGMVEE